MAVTKTLAFVCCIVGSTGATLGIGCAQIFGFDKEYETRPGPDGSTSSTTTTGSAGGGGSAGGPGSGGAGGSGGGGGAGGNRPPDDCTDEPPTSDGPDLTLIDDLEDGDGAIIPLPDPDNRRIGTWFSFNDGGGSQNPPKPGFVPSQIKRAHGRSLWAANSVVDDQFTTWGAGFGFFLDSPAPPYGFYDASAFRGITFWAYEGPGTINPVFVNLANGQTTPAGGLCTACDDHFGRYITFTHCWVRYRIPFSKFKQRGFGTAFDAFDASKIWAIQFTLDPAERHDIWIDDISFYR